MVHLGAFLGEPLGSLLKAGSPLMKSVLKLTKSVLTPLGLTAAAVAAVDAAARRKKFWIRDYTDNFK